MRTSGEKVRISDEAEREIGFIFSYTIIVRVMYSGVLREGKRIGSPARYFARKSSLFLVKKIIIRSHDIFRTT